MAESPSHQWGQILGNALEICVKPLLLNFANSHGFYLDCRGVRPARKRREVIWRDGRGNHHKLDYVLEKGGTEDDIGTPVAFIEIAWRRYTKHSKNKVQEIEAAIQPLLTHHWEAAPFFGVILGGEFTDNALQQLRTTGAIVLHFPYQSILDAFSTVGIDASFEDKKTPDSEFSTKVQQWKNLSETQQTSVYQALIELNALSVSSFMETLSLMATRTIESLRILPLHGMPLDFREAEGAISFLEDYTTSMQAQPLVKYEISIRYSNGNHLEATFFDALSAIQFLRGYFQPPIVPVTTEESGPTIDINQLLADP